MLDYTRATIDKTLEDLKLLLKIIFFSSQSLYILYLTYALISGMGNFTVNVILCVISVAYLVIRAVIYNNSDRLSRKVKRVSKRTYKAIKLSLQAFTLGATIYGIYIAADEFSAISIIFAVFTSIAWLFNLLFELVVIILEKRLNLFKEAISADIEAILKPAQAVKNVFNKITGRSSPDDEAEKEPSKERVFLDSLVTSFRAERKRKKEEKREAKRASKTEAKSREIEIKDFSEK